MTELCWRFRLGRADAPVETIDFDMTNTTATAQGDLR